MRAISASEEPPPMPAMLCSGGAVRLPRFGVWAAAGAAIRAATTSDLRGITILWRRRFGMSRRSVQLEGDIECDREPLHPWVQAGGSLGKRIECVARRKHAFAAGLADRHQPTDMLPRGPRIEFGAGPGG